MTKSKTSYLTFITFNLAILLTVSCGSSPTPMAQSTPIPSGVEVINIKEEETVTNEIMQQKTFDQCDSASPFKAQVQFSQSTGQESQQELVLGVKAGGEAGVSVAAKVRLEGSLEQHFANSKSSAQAHEEGIVIEVQPHTKQEYNIIWREIRREGSVEYTEDGVSKTTSFSYRIGLELVSARGKDLICPGRKEETSSPSPTPLPTYTPLATYTPYPTPVPATPVVKIATATPKPTPTEPANTPPRTILAPGKSWEQDGVVMTLRDFLYDTSDQCVGTFFILTNETNGPIIVSGTARNFEAKDNLGRDWILSGLTGFSQPYCVDEIVDRLENSVPPGEKFDTGLGNSIMVNFSGYLTDNKVEYLDITVDGFSRITGATWRIPVVH